MSDYKASSPGGPDEHVFAHNARPSLRKRICLIASCLLAVFLIDKHVCDSGLLSSFGLFHSLSIEERAIRVLRNSPLIDGHNDLMILIAFAFKNNIYNSTFKSNFENGGMPREVDLPRLDQGMQGGAFWSAFMLCPKNGSDFSDENYSQIVQLTLQQLDLYQRLGMQYPKYFTPAPNVASAKDAFAHKRLISPAGIEGLHQIGNSLANLRLYYSLGVRYATLTWNCHNIYADAALTMDANMTTVKAKPLWGGLSSAGKDMILEMNRMGMIVDLAHVSVDTMRDVLVGDANSSVPHGGGSTWIGSIAPPIFSHSSAYSICPHPRNVPDDILHLVKKRNSIVMINFNPEFISCTAAPENSTTGLPVYYPANNTIHQVVRHITYVGDLIGYDHVGLGTDFDGIESTPKGLEDVSKFPDLVAELLKAGVSEADAGKVVGRNVLRVWKDVEDVAAELQAMGVKPLEDDLGRWWKWKL